MCIELVLADPYPVMLDGLSHVFHDTSEFSVKTCVHHGDAALQAVRHHRPHILVMDLSLTQSSGLPVSGWAITMGCTVRLNCAPGSGSRP